MLTENGTFRGTNRICRVASIVRQPQHIAAHGIFKAAAAAVAVAVAAAAAAAATTAAVAAAAAPAHDTTACVSQTTRVGESLCSMQCLYRQQQHSYCGRLSYKHVLHR